MLFLVLDHSSLSSFLRPFFFLKLTSTLFFAQEKKIIGCTLTLMVCTFPEKVPLFHFQCRGVPSLQPESDPGPLPGSGRWGPPERGRWAGQLLDGAVGEQAKGKGTPWAGNDWPAAEVCKEALLEASHREVGKQMNQSPSLNSEVAEEFHKDSRWLTTNSVAW